MALITKHRIRLAAAALAAGLVSASPAMAGRCGHSFSVDEPTSLAKVARACNVSLSALREANTGVDPAYVRPGEHLAIPDEIASATDVPSGSANVAVDKSYYDSPIHRYVEYTEPARHSGSAKIEPVNPVWVDSQSPYFVRASATLGGPRTMREDKTLSYQQLSAARIRNAGLTMAPVRAVTAPGRGSQVNAPVMVSTRADMFYGDPLSPLMECSVLRRQESGKIAQVREFKPLPEGREPPAHCAAVVPTATRSPLTLNHRLSASDFLRSEYEGAPPSAEFVVLQGFVSAADAECVTLRSGDGMVWRVGVALAPMEMLGKEATVWAEVTDAPQCGGLAMNRAVYAERLR